MTQRQIDTLARMAWTIPAAQFDELPAVVVNRSVELDMLEHGVETVYRNGAAILTARW